MRRRKVAVSDLRASEDFTQSTSGALAGPPPPLKAPPPLVPPSRHPHLVPAQQARDAAQGTQLLQLLTQLLILLRGGGRKVWGGDLSALRDAAQGTQLL